MLTQYTFEFRGLTFEFSATTLMDAFERANRKFRPYAGMWVETPNVSIKATSRRYVWSFGNFSD